MFLIESLASCSFSYKMRRPCFSLRRQWWRSWEQNKENISPYRVVQSPILQSKVVWWLMRNRITGYRCHCYCTRWFHSSLIRSPHWYRDDGSQKPAHCHIRDRQQKSPWRDKWVSVRVVHELEMWPIHSSETERQEIGKSIKLTDKETGTSITLGLDGRNSSPVRPAMRAGARETPGLLPAAS